MGVGDQLPIVSVNQSFDANLGEDMVLRLKKHNLALSQRAARPKKPEKTSKCKSENLNSMNALKREAENAKKVIEVATDQVSKPYRYGAKGPYAFDCSGLICFSFERALNKRLPRTSAEQFRHAPKKIKYSQLRPGDLVFFGSPIHHVGMYIGFNRMIEASHPGDFVCVSAVSKRNDRSGCARWW
jgi:cell wall-associated NlpC family hydrolase